ncbi:PREDICTED: copper chaperone for superoxide dismutase, chloroplastic/cytosolic-like [Populus euphratica]|uniref:Superoxide dismutase copper chaperone n=1 Tax=Populus euphratica TaxID=75702 RepID=A0AAJ6XSE1_POPEU|nr:PREDICTED: copper chaperone for superoxide dismutase, chloroplastic/cytosolic-like [Populus euphratica]
MAFLRSVTNTTKVAIPASALPDASALSSISTSSPYPKTRNLSFLSQPSSFLSSTASGLVKNLTQPPSALNMETTASNHMSASQDNVILPELFTEFMVDMKCEGCVNSVKNKLQSVNGVKNVEVDLANQVVRILGSSPVNTMTEALEQTGRNARLIGQGIPEDFLVSAAVAEFKGPDIFGVVRFAQVNMDLARIEANFTGLSLGKHGWSINEFGDLTEGAASTGKVFNPTNQGNELEPLGDLGTLDVDEKGDAFFSGTIQKLRIADLIGRSLVVYGTEDKSDKGLTAAVIARSAGVGENYKKICTCDGTTIWESSNNDFVAGKV